MIQEIKIKNFRSFKDEVVFSFEASSDKFAESSQVVQVNENTRLLRFAVIYGYNASGKSNLLKVFDFLSDFWFAASGDVDKKIDVEPFKLDAHSPKDHSFFELTFFVENTRYNYLLELDKTQVYYEKLSYYKSTQPTCLFERRLVNNQSDIKFGSTIKISSAAKESIVVHCLKNMSFFAARNQVNVSLPLIDEAKDMMRQKIMPIITPSTELLGYAQRKASKDKDLVSYIVNFLHEADFNITDIKTEIVGKTIPEDLMNMLLQVSSVPVEIKEKVKSERSIKLFETRFEHTVTNERGVEKYHLDPNKDEESRGTIQTFGIETALYFALQKNAFLPIDEIESSLHPKLLEKIIFEYLKTESKSQIIVTTHNDGLLDLIDDLIRKDSVWFTEKDKSGVTDLYKLTDFRGVNRLSSIREAYRNKRFGATMR